MTGNPLDENSIAIIGMSCRFPKADGVEEFWQNLKTGRECISFFSEEELRNSGVGEALFQRPEYVPARGILRDEAGFDADFFDFNPREARLTDIQHRIFLECAWEAIDQAGYDLGRQQDPVGVFAGMDMSRYLLTNIYPALKGMGTAAAYQALLSNDKDFLATLTAYKLNLTGPACSVQTACSTALAAVHLACQSILTGECDMALAGGVCVDVPQKTGYLYEEGMILSPDGHCRPFDAAAKGTLGGNGCGVVLLKRLPEAMVDRDRIRAIIRGSTMNNDGADKLGYTAPGVAGQRRVIAEAQAVAGVDPETITCLEAHGTGTPLGDPVEIQALTQAFGEVSKKQFCAIGSVKGNIGHTGSAAGIAGLIKVTLALEHGVIPPSINFQAPNPHIDFSSTPFYVNTQLLDWRTTGIPRRAGVSAFGIGGTNVHMILEESSDPPIPDSKPGRSQLIPISARTAAALDTASKNLAEHFKNNPNASLADAAYTLQKGRKEFDHRRILVCDDAALTVALESPNGAGMFTGVRNENTPEIVFMFPGQGTQYTNMAKGLYDSEPVFRQEVDHCAQLLREDLAFDLRRAIYPEGRDKMDLNHTAVAQPAIFVVSYALAKLWMSWGIHPNAMIGHSIGEYVAATLAGVFSPEDALRLVAERGRLMGEMPAGAMTAVQMPADEISPLLNQDLSIAAVNMPSLCVVSGPEMAVSAFERRLAGMGADTRRLHTSHAFHSAMMDPALKSFERVIQGVPLSRPRIPYVSNLTGNWIQPEEAIDPDYWIQHMRRTVRFSDGMGILLADSNRIFLEVGPGRTLSALTRRHPDRNEGQTVLTSMRHPREDRPDRDVLLTALGRLWISGAAPNWDAVHRHPRRRIPLPTYPFERKRFWYSPGPSVEAVSALAVRTETKGDMADWFYVPSWKRSLPHACSADLTEPKTWLILGDDGGFGSGLAQVLEDAGHAVLLARPRPDFGETENGVYTMNPAESSDYDALLRALAEKARMPEIILHLWHLDPAAHGVANLPRILDRGLHSLLNLVQALGRRNVTDSLKIIAVTSESQDVTGTETLCPAKAALLGPVKVIPLEYPNIQCRCIDMLPPGPEEAKSLMERLLGEILSKNTDPITAFRGSYRWVPDIAPVRLEPDQNKTRLRNQGVYLVTGGLGGVGLSIAEFLAEKFQARLILSGRSRFPDRAEWDDWLAEHGEGDPVSQNILKLRRILAAGAEVLIRRADVSDREQMGKAVETGRRRFGGIHGVIHTAGLADQAGVIQRRTREMTEEILAPKIAGLFVLEELFKAEKLDFIFLCSSLGNFLYHTKFGQTAYNAANEFLDLYACYQTRTDGPFTVSVNWDDWREVGMSVAAMKRRPDIDLKGVFSEGLTPSEGGAVFGRIVEYPFQRLAVSTRDLRLQIEEEAGKTRMILDTLLKRSGDQPTHDRPELPTAYEAPEDEVETSLADIWGELLGIGEIGVHDNFFELGGDSLLATQVISRVREVFDVPVSLNAFFENPTVKGLAGAVFQEKITAGDKDGMTRLLDEIEQMSEEEIARKLSE